MPKSLDQAEVRVGPQGRIVIPVEMRRILELNEGETLVVWIENGRLVLETRKNILKRLQDHFAVIAPEASLANELITERREQARQELSE